MGRDCRNESDDLCLRHAVDALVTNVEYVYSEAVGYDEKATEKDLLENCKAMRKLMTTFTASVTAIERIIDDMYGMGVFCPLVPYSDDEKTQDEKDDEANDVPVGLNI
jgi:hypothetical protein